MYSNQTKLVDNDIKKIGLEVNKAKKTKLPTSTLVFKRAEIGHIQCFTKGLDGFFYVIARDGTLKKYGDITSETVEPLETGMVWDRVTYGRPIQINQVKDGFVVFANFEVDQPYQANIYKLASLSSEPVLKYSSTAGEHSVFGIRNTFGIKTYWNGFSTFILAGVYGRGQVNLDLLLSTDDGESFKVIKKTKNADGSGNFNSHWHDVAIDPYHGLLWASEGDSDINNDVWFSENLGETWTKLPEFESGTNQPTALMVFPDKIVMGRDGAKPGFDTFHKPNTVKEFSNLETPKVLKELKTDTQSIWYYGQSPIVDGSEGYFYFNITENEPRMIVATGDFGESLHSVFMGFGGENDLGSISSLAEIDSDYVYAFGPTSAGNIFIYYAERVVWSEN